MNLLPDDCLIYIFSFLNFNDNKQYRLTNKNNNIIMQNKKICMNYNLLFHHFNIKLY